jgi:hypothetical protein
VSSQTKAAQKICRDWQRAIRCQFGERFSGEFPIAPLKIGFERIDLVDQEGGIAYELKASPNNTHFEFYRDIFKLAVYNRKPVRKFSFRKLIFITPQIGAKKLNSAFVKDVLAIAGEKFDLQIEIAGI